MSETSFLNDKEVNMYKKILIAFLVLLVGFTAGLIGHLYYYPRETFGPFYEELTRDCREGWWVHHRELSCNIHFQPFAQCFGNPV